jgi:dTDP-glucose pyrophosphorylase
MNKINIGVIPAAGEGTRACPLTKYIPKPMVRVGGKPILEYNLEIMRDHVDVREVFIIVGHLGGQVKEYFQDGRKWGVNIRYVTQTKLGGIGAAIYLLKDVIKEKFVVILGDELYVNSNHREITAIKHEDFDAVCCFIETPDKEKIKRNYSAEFSGGKIVRLIEKPRDPQNNFLGCGTYVMTPKIFEFIRKTPPSQLRNEIEITDALSNLAADKKVYPFFLTGSYINITDQEDMNAADGMSRSMQAPDLKISLVIPSFNEELSIEKVIDEFNLPSIHEMIVVDNNSTDRTAQLAFKKGARVVPENKKGYGSALKKGMDSAHGEVVILTEADGTFRSKDVGRILERIKDADMVVGTRTSRQWIEPGSNMGWLLRWGNILFGKLVKILWWHQAPGFTDVGCTFRAIRKDSYLRIRKHLNANGPEFSPEMMIECLNAGLKVVEMPVSYCKRYGGESKHSAGAKKLHTGFKMLILILRKRLGRRNDGQ